MYLLELATQNVRGFSPNARVSLGPGYSVLRAPGSEPVPLIGLVLALLYPDGRGEDATFSAGAQPGRAALTLQGNDMTTYRLVRELGGVGGLHRLNKAAGKFELVTREALELGQFLRGQVGAPSRSTFEHLYTLSSGQFPSRRPKQPRPAEEKKLPGLATAAPVTAASDIGAAEAKLRDLERELQLSRQIDELQFKQDGLASQMFELETKLRSTEGLKGAVAEAQAAYEAAPTPASVGLPEDIVTRCERYPQLVQKRDEALARLQQERETAVESVPVGVEPLYRDMRFVAGVATGAIVLVAGALLDGLWRYVALLDIPAFGFAALVALKWVDDVQGAQRSGRKEGVLAAREKKIHEEFEAEAAHVRNAIQALGVETAQEVIEVLSRKAELAARVEALKQQLAEAEADPEIANAARQYDALKRESDAITGKLQALSTGYVRDPREVEREIERVRQSIELARSGASPSQPTPEAHAAPSSGAVYEDPSPMLLSLAADLLQLDIPGVAALIKDRCAQYIGALCDRRYLAVEFDLKGNATLSAPDKRIPARDLPPRDLDLYYLSLRLTLIEKASAKARIPFLVEDPIGPVEEPRFPLVGRMLKHLGTLTQVLHLSAGAAFGTAADSNVSV